MARAFGAEPGGILGLDALLEEHGEAIEYDLIALGLRLRMLGTDALGWTDLRAIVKHLPMESALLRVMYPEASRWQTAEHLLADVADSLHWLMWARTDDGRRGRNRPEPIARPGLKSDRERVGTATQLDQMNEFLGWHE
ncbi:DUF5361 domain-containing protein [Nocardia halotolerans]|uniref:DUF5361 domain-containing protein n=1 Tax=Nocardia halotolerans TaxID=1755878 RepID=A0ABV8VHD6_9NOCA